ncbi:MAG: hypothetical protein WCJ92_00600 [Alphaproteobacteria bacterium]
MKKFFKTWIIFIFLAVAGVALVLHSSLKKNPTKIDIYPKVCTPGALMGPNNKYAVWVWCDDGGGTNIGIIKIRAAEACSVSRFWHDSKIFLDIRSIEWSSDGTELKIESGSIYGTGKTYRLDLEQRKVLDEHDNPTSA